MVRLCSSKSARDMGRNVKMEFCENPTFCKKKTRQIEEAIFSQISHLETWEKFCANQLPLFMACTMIRGNYTPLNISKR